MPPRNRWWHSGKRHCVGTGGRCMCKGLKPRLIGARQAGPCPSSPLPPSHQTHHLEELRREEARAALVEELAGRRLVPAGLPEPANVDRGLISQQARRGGLLLVSQGGPIPSHLSPPPTSSAGTGLPSHRKRRQYRPLSIPRISASVKSTPRSGPPSSSSSSSSSPSPSSPFSCCGTAEATRQTKRMRGHNTHTYTHGEIDQPTWSSPSQIPGTRMRSRRSTAMGSRVEVPASWWKALRGGQSQVYIYM